MAALRKRSGCDTKDWVIPLDMLPKRAERADGGITRAQLQDDVFQTSVQALLDLWQVRFGTDWVPVQDITNNNFYGLVYTRLKGLGKLEVHYLTDCATYVCRKPE